MKKVIVVVAFMFLPFQAKADLWGADLPLLAEIVFNTLHTMMELEKQSRYWSDEMAGIHDRIDRIQTIANVVDPADWDKWKDPREALNRLRLIYHTIPKEYRNEKSDAIEAELANAMNLVARLKPETESSFRSGKELERRGADASPGVAQKLSASGIGSLVSIQSQSLAVQSHITSLLAQMIAEANERETRAVASRGNSFRFFATNLKQTDFRFSKLVLGARESR
jgi:hypothetical protein